MRRFEIAAAVRADVPALHALIRGLAEYERLTSICVSTDADLDNALFGEQPAAEALIARDRDNGRAAVGFALFFQTYSTFVGRRGLWLEDVFVVPEHRGAGLGRELLVTLAQIAQRRGCGRFEWAVLDWNASAIRFYESLGATIMPDWRLARVTGRDLERLARHDRASPSRESGPKS